jgi:hypothetical protein
MTNTKTLMLAAVAALTLGVGTAMAQEGGNGDALTPYWTLQRQADTLHRAEARNPALIQSGSSDQWRSGPHVLPFNGNYGTLANPG